MEDESTTNPEAYSASLANVVFVRIILYSPPSLGPIVMAFFFSTRVDMSVPTLSFRISNAADYPLDSVVWCRPKFSTNSQFFPPNPFSSQASQ